MARATATQGVVQRFLRTVDRLDLQVAFVGIAISGGIDSTALAICCAEAKRSIGLLSVLLHIDHNIRPGSAADADIARHTADGLGLPIEVATLPPNSPTNEESLREARYDALTKLLAMAGTHTLLTGHHADDQAETVLLHLIRGSGLAGASGMRERQPFQLETMATSIDLIRPLLQESRADLAALVAASGLVVAEDESNGNVAYARNRMRINVIPELNRINPAATRHLALFAGQVATDSDLLDSLARAALNQMSSSPSLEIAPLREQPDPILGRMIRHWIHEQTGLELGNERTVSVLALIKQGSGGTIIEIGEGWTVTRAGKQINLARTTMERPGGLSES